ncbi:hypothetical protein BHE74_00019670 [Ensete ventricosum]|nr:hypothetical protein BHE74_00019670 [Ensete ventricosum]
MEDAEQVMHLRGILSSSKAIKSMSEDWLVEAGLSPAPRGMAYLIFVICWPSFTPLFYFRFWIYANGHSVLCRNEPQGDEGNVRREIYTTPSEALLENAATNLVTVARTKSHEVKQIFVMVQSVLEKFEILLAEEQHAAL